MKSGGKKQRKKTKKPLESTERTGREGGYPTLLELDNLIEFETITAPKF